MNNARFIRELDFARVDFYERTGLYATATEKGGVIVMGACTIRYRRFIKLFSRFVIESKVSQKQKLQSEQTDNYFVRERSLTYVILST